MSLGLTYELTDASANGTVSGRIRALADDTAFRIEQLRMSEDNSALFFEVTDNEGHGPVKVYLHRVEE